jgi:hypothetical protein
MRVVKTDLSISPSIMKLAQLILYGLRMVVTWPGQQSPPMGFTIFMFGIALLQTHLLKKEGAEIGRYGVLMVWHFSPL